MSRTQITAWGTAVLACWAGWCRADLATTSYSAREDGPGPAKVTISTAAGSRLIEVRLEGLKRGTKVRRARLLIQRVVEDPGDLLDDILIYAADGPEGKPLRLAAPGYDAFDATEATAAAVAAGSPRLRLAVKQFPGWRPEQTRLELVYEGAGEEVPAAVTGLKALHRAGQTFLTWCEVDPPTTTDTLRWGECRKLMQSTALWRYRIYTHSRPISAQTVLDAELIGEVGPLSCWNIHGRNMEYLIGESMLKCQKMGELAENYNALMYTWGPNSDRMDTYPLRRLAIDEEVGPLPPGTGLYVASPTRAGKRYYAVTSCRGGVENLAAFSADNSLSEPVEEAAGPGEPVLQGPGLWGPYFDYPGRRQIYVQWCAPPLAPRANMYFNWSVLVPPEEFLALREQTFSRAAGPRKLPGELYFHADNFSYAQPRRKYLFHSIQLAPHDWPFSGWYGFNEAYGTLRGYRSASVANHTQQRVLAFLQWAKGNFPLDADRVMLTGSDGAVMMALAFSEMFSYVLVDRFDEYAVLPARARDLAMAWGPRHPQLKDAFGRGDWGWAMLDQLVLSGRKTDLPLIFCRGKSWGRTERKFARGEGPFYVSMRQANQPIVADWTWDSGYLVKPDQYSGLWRGLDLTRTAPLPAFSHCSTDRNTEGDGQTNLPMAWTAVKDEPESMEVGLWNTRGAEATVNVAMRRLQRFKPAAGQRLAWEAVSDKPSHATGKPPAPQSGSVIVDEDGVFVVKGLTVTREVPLVLRVTRGK